jgi:DNA topoisomerase-1
MIIKDGRFGAYVTDGEVNATLRRGDDIDSITGERAAALLAEKRAKGPAQKVPARRVAKKSATKKAAAAAGTGGRPKSARKAATRKRPEAAAD